MKSTSIGVQPRRPRRWRTGKRTPAAARVTVRIETLILPTFLPAAPDKNPMFLDQRVYQGSSGKVYPLPFTDRIAETPVRRKWKAIWIENEFLRVLVLPEIGGRIHAMLDKTNGYDLIYHQPVIKPALVGLAGPWLSGGIEFNWPQHHRPATFLPVDYEIAAHADGSKTIWCSDHDPLQRMKGMHGICLHPNRACLELKVRAYNRTPHVQTFLWWANVATRVHEAYQSFFPPDVHCVADHARRSMSEYPLAWGHYYGVNYGQRGQEGIPAREVPAQFVPPHVAAGILPAVKPGFQSGGKHAVDSAGMRNSEVVAKVDADPDGKMPRSSAGKMPAPTYAPNDLSFYANIPVPTSYMAVGGNKDFSGGYDYKAQAGIIHIANHHISPGKKQWTWGNHDFGYAWDRNLTEPDADGICPPYLELMAGVYTDNQPDFSFLQPGETKTWSQYWYPIQKIGPAQHANLEAAVSLVLRKKDFQIGLAVTRPFPKAVVRLERTNGASAAEWNVNLAPGKPFILSSPQAIKPWKIGETVLRVLDRTGHEIIAYRPSFPVKAKLPAPASEPPAPADVASADELYLTGLHLEQYRHATRCPTLYWREALRRDPYDARCNNALGLWHLRRGEFTLAETHFRRAIKRLTQRNANPYDGEAYYNLGLCLRHLARSPRGVGPEFVVGGQSTYTPRGEDEAYAAFYKSTWNQAWAAAGYHALAEIDCTREDWATALDHLNRSLRFNTDNLRARNLKVLVLRKLTRVGRAARRLQPARMKLEEAATALLRETLTLDPLDRWARWLNGEKPAGDLQTALDLAHDLTRAGRYAEAIELLGSVTHPDLAGSSPRPGSRTA